ncbi:hypothetical protein [Salinisphaera hydrothermalis]|uniref:Endonuclease n=1 Tax=Salinisphaera hydrothermalis (strain C41B8) TaxID=1304275 RepID=A0A084IPG4_SALHC|nr:hypothetical protein [Salinisphaera hydrothermalis]KEZ78598.1 hypothetical protein C41B8_03246 [Salinisphaera hydrothermalis C41B8]
MKQTERIDALLAEYGRTFAAELGVDLSRNTPSPLFRLLCLALLTSAPVQAEIAMRAARAMADAGWTTPKKLAASTWPERVKVLNGAGYARVDEKTATQIMDFNHHLLDAYDGDLRQLRAEANGDPDAAIRALKRFKGIGDTGAAIFLREVQAVWGEFYPFADKASLSTAEKLGLPTDAAKLARLSGRADFPRLVAALVRVKLAHDIDRFRD